MVDLLALHPVTKFDQIIQNVPRPASGLPINFLPGWNRVPLCSKLPMLDTPINEIIFTRDKIGKTLWKPGDYVLYDPNCFDFKLDYDPLHDPHLKYFYRRPINLERIKEIGRITNNKDVVCNLKDFNAYRRYLRQLHIDAINKEIEQKELQQRDRFLLKNAEDVALKQAKKYRNAVTRTRSEIVRIKSEKERQYRDKAIAAMLKFKRAIDRIEAIKRWKTEMVREKSRLHGLTVEARIERTKEAKKLKIIALSKKFKKRDVQLVIFFKLRLEETRQIASMKKIVNWNRRLEYHVWKHEVNKQLRNEAFLERTINVQKHRKNMQVKWNRIQMRITNKGLKHRNRNLMNELSYRLRKKVNQNFQTLRTDDHLPGLRANQISKKSTTSTARHSQQELQDVLSTAISLHDIQPTDEASSEMVLNSAKYILENVIKTVNRNLDEDLLARSYLNCRLTELFHRIKKHVLLKIDRVLQAHDEPIRQPSSVRVPPKSSKLSKSVMLPLWSDGSANTVSKVVSFGSTELIGKSAQQIDPLVELKSVRNRTPTPASSFTSLNAVGKETSSNQDVELPVRTRENNYELSDWTPKEKIFVEHVYIKFKKALLVGVERTVFEAIDFKKGELRLYAKREILDLDRKYLTNIMAESILTYNLNSYNYFGNTRLCISVLAADCLCDLEKTRIRMKYDPAYRVKPHCRGANM